MEEAPQLQEPGPAQGPPLKGPKMKKALRASIEGGGSPAPAAPRPERPEGYSRKAKSLSLLCENFISRFGIPGTVISLDGSARSLGVERRRIYDIVNVLESVKVVEKVQKNQYAWHGLERLATSLAELRAQAEAELAEVGAGGDDSLTGLDERKEKSMTRLSQRFVQMFMLSKTKSLGLDEAARALLGGSEDAGHFKTKVRRLYDIANILSALHLIEKAHVGEKGRPGFQWLGPEAGAQPQLTEEQAAVVAGAQAGGEEMPYMDAATAAAGNNSLQYLHAWYYTNYCYSNGLYNNNWVGKPAGEEGLPPGGLVEGMQVVGEELAPQQLPDGGPGVGAGEGEQAPGAIAQLPGDATHALAQIQQTVTAQAEGLPEEPQGQQPLQEDGL
ncbi:hypothetical protein APUTEX25_003218 [Auxenochlorella protothecoides]|uniref:E2F/DP family winged-helix DNA-binding domain-containing protein n=1 Tax=Auxenochlorella protothecoides TaxID=3075 RepID=A0A3M7KUZ3_AUXPR|nr:hypothetical protein APUTEX25_003218 [Auxenochlorella protothecoides]|eukprot:RMZ53684.1 hypothetical protein APUTEX25_003218 [Auxenochlorella protothecoides]